MLASDWEWGHGDIVGILDRGLRGSSWRHPRCYRRLSGGSTHGNIVLIHVVVFRANTSERYHAFVEKVAVEALTELKHARSVGQRPRDAESLTSCLTASR